MTRTFYQDLPRLTSFERIFDPEAYHPVPDDWWVACSDVVGSTRAIEAGRYKEVNTAGSLAAMALANAFGGMDFPFFFGGDGMVCLVPESARRRVADLLAGTARRVRESLDLELRVGLVPVAHLRAAGHRLNLAKLEVSPQYCQALLEGGGFDEADRLLKLPGSPYAVPEDLRGEEPDFGGYTCRWKDYRSPHGETAALIVRFRDGGPDWARSFVRRLEALIGGPDSHHPIRPDQSRPAWGRDLDTETAVRTRGARGWARWRDRMAVRLQVGVSLFAILTRLRIHLGRKDLSRTIEDNVLSSDYRKFDNTLKMVVAVRPEVRRALEVLLESGRAEGKIHYGLHVSDRAVLTCLMHTGAGHEVHFVDAAEGGYAFAARQLKSQLPAG